MKKSMKLQSNEHRFLFMLIGLFVSLGAFAQQITVNGHVKDDTGEPVIGASVLQANTTNGTITDMDGNFTLSVPANSSLTVSFIGYATQEVAVGGKTSLVIVLKEDAKVLDEVVVVGYGTMKKSDLTGAVSSVGTKDIKDSPVANIGQAMQGKVSGVQIIDAGKPGDNVTIKIRGLGTINNSDPLVVIDGIPTDLGLSSLNMADVERVDVLKDASATAIYGSRGANGVVMITSKRGAEGAAKVSVTANWAFQNATKVPDMLNAAQYAELNNDMLSAVDVDSSLNPLWADPSALGAGTNWLDELLRTGFKQNYSLSYSGGTDKAHYYVSGGFLDQSGIVESVSYRRFNFQANSDAQVNKWLKFTTNLTFSTDVKKSGDYSIGNAMKALPTFPVKNEDGSWSGPDGNAEWYGSTRNPIGPAQLVKNETKGYNFLANITGEITFTKWLKLKSTFGYDAKFWFEDNFVPAYNWKPTPVEESSRYKKDNKSFTYLWDNYFVFDHTFARKHRVGLMAGSSAQWNEYDYFNAQKNAFMFDNIHEMDNGEKMYSIGGSSNGWSLLSLMARFNYSYADRYLLTATVRRDGSSRFGKNNRWGTFPSVSLAWRMSQEEWFPKDNFMVNDLKLRLGYGVTGNQEIGNYGFVATYNTGTYPFGGNNSTALVSSTLSNPNIHWEEVRQTNFGVDLGLFNSRVSLSLDAYIKNTNDMLVKASVPITSGFEDTTTTYTNAGKVRNKGVEMTLRTINLQGPLSWETSVTATYNKNEILDLNSETPMYINQMGGAYLTLLKAGYPINVLYGYMTDGLFQNQKEVDMHATQTGAAPGDIRFKDLNNDGLINDEDRTVIGNPNPNWFFSMSNSLSYKGFELSVFLQGVTGNKIYNANNIDNEGMAAAYNQTTSVLGRWTGEGTSYSMPRAVWGDPNQNNRVSDRFVENGSYLRLKNITLSYTFPKRWMQKIQIENARLSFACENVATLTGYSGFDPEVDINGIDNSRYPISRTFSMGLNFNF